MSLFGAYIHAKPNGTPFYVGKGRVERAKRLDASHHNKHHNRVVTKYGRNNILMGFMECSSESIAFELEIGLIKCCKRMGITLANVTAGGEGVSGPKTVQHRLNLSAALKGRQGTFLGKRHTQASLDKMSAVHKGSPSPRKGVKLTQLQCEEMRIRATKQWESADSRQAQRDIAKSQMKPVLACGILFESLHAYCAYTNRALSTVARWVKNNWQHKIDEAYMRSANES